jgi:hypothetical protein
MKKILSIIVVVILFITSGLIFWAGLAPESYSKFWTKYTVVDNAVNKVCDLGVKCGLLYATSSESIISTKGQVTIGDDKVWNVEIADNETQRVNGLSNRRTLYKQSGMLFAFDKADYQSFWMKDMLIPLDIIFFDENWKIVLIEKNLSPKTFPKIFGNEVKSKYVLEINAGEADLFDLKLGDQGIFSNK